MNGKFDGFKRDDLMALADTSSLSKTIAAEIVEEVARAVSRWEEFAAQAGAPEAYVQQIKKNRRLFLARAVAGARSNSGVAPQDGLFAAGLRSFGFSADCLRETRRRPTCPKTVKLSNRGLFMSAVRILASCSITCGCSWKTTAGGQTDAACLILRRAVLFSSANQCSGETGNDRK